MEIERNLMNLFCNWFVNKPLGRRFPFLNSRILYYSSEDYTSGSFAVTGAWLWVTVVSAISQIVSVQTIPFVRCKNDNLVVSLHFTGSNHGSITMEVLP